MTFACAATVVGLAPAANAAYTVEPVGPGWVPNGGVHSVLVSGSTVYVGGSFTGGVAALTADTGRLLWLGNANGDVRALALAPNGQLLLGGAFTTVGGTTHRKLAAVNAGTGAVNDTFKPAVGGTVRDIVVVGSTAYFGGAFTSQNGIAQGGLGAVDTTAGRAVPAFTASTNGQVYSLGTDGSRLFVGGKFTAVNGQPRNYLASVTLSTNTLDAWAPALPCTGCNVIWDLTLDNARNRVYTVGRNAGTLFTVDKNTAATVYRNVGSINGDSQAVTLAPDGRVYVGGHFVTVNGQTRMLVAEFDVSGRTPVLGAFSTRFVTSYPGVWAMASTSTRLYVGGEFTAAGSQVNGRNAYPYFAMFPSTGTAPADVTEPTVTASSPAANAVDVAVSAAVTATFSEPVVGVSPSTFTLQNTATGAAVTARAVTYDTTARTATFNPSANLAPSTQYTVTLTGGSAAIRDNAGNPLRNPTGWSFTTARAATDTTQPTVTGTSPTNGATGVAVSANVTATFSEPVQGVDGNFTVTPDAGGPAVAATVRPGATNQYILDPTADLDPGTSYTATLNGDGATGIKDAGSNPLTTVTWSFTTADGTTDTTPPTWTGRIPSANNATGVSRTANVTVTFSEVVQNVTTTTFTLTPTAGGSRVAATVTFSSTNGRWVLNPSSTLAANTGYTAVVTTAVTDLAGNPFGGMTWSFTTGA